MTVEIRTYKIKRGRRHEFVDLFLKRAAPAQLLCGIRILGPFLDTADEDRVVFLRSFPSIEARERMLQAFYESGAWKHELESVLKPMIEQSEMTLTETADGWLTFGAP